MATTELIPRQTVTTICDNVLQAQAEIARAFALLATAKDRLTAVIGGQLPYRTTAYLWEREISCNNLPRSSEKSQQYVTRNAWRYVIDLCGLKAYLTEARQQELYTQLEKDQFPPLTPDNVLSTLAGFAGRVDSLLTESALEVFEWLRPHSDASRAGQLKTNKHWQIGTKAIACYVVDVNYTGGYRLNYHREANLRSLGNVFSLLDGQGAQQYPNDLRTQLTEGLKAAHAGTCVTTPYLTLKPYRNGNAHLHFLRTDLVDKLNALCGDGTLPGAEHV